MRRSLVVAVSVAAVLGLSGCASDGGTAARTNAGDVSMATLAAEVAQLQAAQQAPATKPASGVTVANLQRLVQDIVIGAEAQGLGVKVTDTQVSKAIDALAAQNGGQAALEQLALQSGIAPAAIADVVRTNLLIAAIGAKLDSKGSSQEQLMAAQTALVQFASTLDITVAPRFGRWDDSTLSIADVSGTSVKAPATTATIQE